VKLAKVALDKAVGVAAAKGIANSSYNSKGRRCRARKVRREQERARQRAVRPAALVANITNSSNNNIKARHCKARREPALQRAVRLAAAVAALVKCIASNSNNSSNTNSRRQIMDKGLLVVAAEEGAGAVTNSNKFSNRSIS